MLVRQASASALAKERGYWGGGSVALALATTDFKSLKCHPSERLEDGTVRRSRRGVRRAAALLAPVVLAV